MNSNPRIIQVQNTHGPLTQSPATRKITKASRRQPSPARSGEFRRIVQNAAHVLTVDIWTS